MTAARAAVRICLLTEKYKLQTTKKYKKISGKHKHTFINLELEAVHINREKGSDSMKTNKPQLFPVGTLIPPLVYSVFFFNGREELFSLLSISKTNK